MGIMKLVNGDMAARCFILLVLVKFIKFITWDHTLLRAVKGSSVALRGLSRALRDSLSLSRTLRGLQKGLKGSSVALRGLSRSLRDSQGLSEGA